MREIGMVLLACNLLSGCAHATEHKPAPKSSHAKIHSEYKVYNADRNTMADVDAALARAAANGTKAMIVMGANWCHDSRGFAARMARPEFQTLVQDNYELVYVSVGINPGQKNQNKDVSKRFGVDQIEGTPTVFIVNGMGTVLNMDSAGYWRRADSIPVDMSFAYFEMYAKR